MNIDSNTPDSLYCQSDTDLYPPCRACDYANLNVIPEGRVSNTISKGSNYKFSPNIDFLKCCKGITGSLNDLSKHWCKQELRWRT